MTNGTSQGLFVVVAILIFGIFVLISYLLFRDNLKPSLSGIFTDGLEQAERSLKGIEKEKLINVQSSREDETYIYAKIREADESKGETEIWVQAKKIDDGKLQLYGSSISDGSYSTGSSNMTGSLSIPDTINGMKITSSGSGVFQKAIFSGELRMPSGLTDIGAMAFRNSKFTGELKLSSGLTDIGYMAFYDSNFSGKLELPSVLSSIGNWAFQYSTFSGELKLPNKLTYIGYMAFYNSNFSDRLELPNGLTDIGTYAFYSSKFTGTLDVSNVNYVQGYAFGSSKIEKVIRGDVAMTDGSDLSDIYGIHPQAIQLSNGSYYNGSNDN